MDGLVHEHGEPWANYSLVTLCSRDFLPIIIQHGHIPPVIGTTEADNLVLPMSLFPQKLVNLVIEVSDLVVAQAG